MLGYLHCIMPSVIEPGLASTIIPHTSGSRGEAAEERERAAQHYPCRHKYRSFIMKEIMVQIELARTENIVICNCHSYIIIKGSSWSWHPTESQGNEMSLVTFVKKKSRALSIKRIYIFEQQNMVCWQGIPSSILWWAC